MQDGILARCVSTSPCLSSKLSRECHILTATPDLRVIPAKYRPYINPSLRRVYIPVDANHGATRIRVVQLEAMIENLRNDKTRLMERAEANIAKAHAMGDKERRTREENAQLRRELQAVGEKYADMKGKYAIVKDKYKTLKHAARCVVVSHSFSLFVLNGSFLH